MKPTEPVAQWPGGAVEEDPDARNLGMKVSEFPAAYSEAGARRSWQSRRGGSNRLPSLDWLT